jgi:hypothetical protein
MDIHTKISVPLYLSQIFNKIIVVIVAVYDLGKFQSGKKVNCTSGTTIQQITKNTIL